jgi:hypothetical protein
MKKHHNKRHLKQAFSIIEISIVIIVIGILIVGIVKGKDLYIVAKSSTAKNLTNNSHIVRIKSLATWHDSSVSDFGLGDKLKDESILENWPDISPFGKGLSRGGTSLSCAPAGNCKYLEDGISNIPAVNFSNNATFTGSTNFSATNNYTIVLVFSFNNSSVNQRILNIGNVSINYLTTSEKLSIISGTNSFEVANFPSKCQSVSTSFVCAVVISKQTTGVADSSVYINSIVKETILDSTATLPDFTESSTLTIAGPSAVAANSIPALNNFSGNFSEVMLFNDYFSAKEVNKLMKEYIAKKYSIFIKEGSQAATTNTGGTSTGTGGTGTGGTSTGTGGTGTGGTGTGGTGDGTGTGGTGTGGTGDGTGDGTGTGS